MYFLFNITFVYRMINLSKMKEKHRNATDGGPPTKKQSPGELVLRKGWYISQTIFFHGMIGSLKSSNTKFHSMSAIIFIILKKKGYPLV